MATAADRFARHDAQPTAMARPTRPAVAVGWRRTVRWPTALPTHRITTHGRQILVLGDVHLTPARPDTWATFVAFLDRLSPTSTAAVICLGDLFEFYIGAPQLLGPDGAILSALHRLRQRGISIAFIPGNRDFLVGPEFPAHGIPVFRDWLRLAIDPPDPPASNGETWITHGDALMLHDSFYQLFRTVMHSPFVRYGARFVPGVLRRLMAHALRARSVANAKRRDAHPMTFRALKNRVRRVDPALEHAMMHLPESPHTLILGHFHVPRIERFSATGTAITGGGNGSADISRAVLTAGEWFADGGIIARYTPALGWHLAHSRDISA